MCAKSATFPLSIDTLRALGGWTADCAERALPLFEQRFLGDAHPLYRSYSKQRFLK